MASTFLTDSCSAWLAAELSHFFFFLIPSSFTPINPHIWPISSAIQPCQSTPDFFFFFKISVRYKLNVCPAEAQFHQSPDLLIIIHLPVRKSITSEEHSVTSGLFPENFMAMTQIVRRNFGSTVRAAVGCGRLNQS